MTTNHESLIEEFKDDIDNFVYFLHHTIDCNNCPARKVTKGFDCGDDCFNSIKQWLNQEVEE